MAVPVATTASPFYVPSPSPVSISKPALPLSGVRNTDMMTVNGLGFSYQPPKGLPYPLSAAEVQKLGPEQLTSIYLAYSPQSYANSSPGLRALFMGFGGGALLWGYTHLLKETSQIKKGGKWPLLIGSVLAAVPLIAWTANLFPQKR
jgi:hypothetical protein